MHQNGNFIITWTNYGEIYFQQYTKDGVRLGNIIKLDNNNDSYGHTPNISIDSSENFVIVWLEVEYEIYAQRFSYEGIELGSKFQSI